MIICTTNGLHSNALISETLVFSTLDDILLICFYTRLYPTTRTHHSYIFKLPYRFVQHSQIQTKTIVIFCFFIILQNV